MNKLGRNKGFSLVELSIVILIIGLLVAGISSGTKLIQQAELRSIISEGEEMTVNFNTFKATYGAIPGDFSGASVFFTDCAETASNCNGNGDGNIGWAAGVSDEIYKAMVHMARAEITQNNIAAMPDAHAGNIQNGVVNGKRVGSGLFYGGFTGVTLAGGFNPLFTNQIAVYLGEYDGTFGYVYGALTADEAFQIDRKIDDGSTSGGAAVGFDTGTFRASDDGSGANNCLNAGDTAYNIGNTSRCMVGAAVE